MSRLLLVEDDLTFAKILEAFLKKLGHEVEVAHKLKAGSALLEQNKFDLLLLDYRLPDGIGLDLLKISKQKDASVPVIIMTSIDDVKTAVNAIRSGAYDYITKPVNPDELQMVVEDALKKSKSETLEKREVINYRFIDGVSNEAQSLIRYIELVAPTDMSVIIQGESGTGKEYAARKIHGLSKRASHPFVAIDCGALSNELAVSELFGHVKGAFTGALSDKVGQFEYANGGTLFLDEVGNLGYEVQVKLLRAIQERVVQPLGSNRQVNIDVRIITATNEDLVKAVGRGDFREDLYHRLNEFKVTVPALREREEDIPLFIQHFVDISNRELNKHVRKMSPEAMAALEAYEWPGNLREMRNIVKRAVLLAKGEEAEKETLPEEMLEYKRKESKAHQHLNLKEMNEVNEKELIVRTLGEARYNKSKAARLLHIDRKTLYNKMLKYDIDG